MSPLVLASFGFVIAGLCAAIMGYAIQRGATCMVAAVTEVVEQRRANRIIALGEAAVWVTGGVLLWRMLGGQIALPIGYPATLTTVAGGLLLGLGALVCRACVFGALARLGSGEWAYVLTPLGFFLGCASLWPLIRHLPPMHVASPLLAVPDPFAPVLLAPFALFAVWRMSAAWQAGRAGMLGAHVWDPHNATAVIGIAFTVLLVLAGPWAYTSALSALAMGRAVNLPMRIALLGALLAGALAGGWTAGRLKPRLPTVAAAGRCLIGGILMGWGSLLIPGGNDDLLLLGLPMLQPYAMLAAASMVVAIALGLMIERRLFIR
ncbi:MAG: YeeE/YedE thiosulfate transporter family protein [Novosphingobium sp.]